MPTDPADQYLHRLRAWRNRREPDLTLGFLRDQFKREVVKPARQLADMVELWQELVPANLVANSRLETISRGVLKVSVVSSARLYELDRLLRGGLEQELIKRNKGPAVRRIQLRVAPLEKQ